MATSALLAQSDLPAAPERAADVTVVVVATRAAEPTLETAGTAAAVEAEQLRRSGAVTLDDALRYEPGVSVPFDFVGGDGLVPYLGGGSQGINIRGIEGNRVALMVDGIRQPEDFVAQSFLGAGGPGRIYFDPGVLEQMEIFKSATSSLYGSDAMGGTVLARTVRPESVLGSDLKGRLLENTLTYASVNSSLNNRLVAAAGNGKFAASVVYSARDGSERRNNGDHSPNPENFTSHAVVATGAMQAGDWLLDGTVDSFRHDNFVHALSAEGSFFDGALVNDQVTQDHRRTRTRISVGGRLDKPEASPAFDMLDVRGYWQEAEAESYTIQRGWTQFGPAPTPRDRHNDITYYTRIRGLEVQAEKFLPGSASQHQLRYGAEYSHTNVASAFLRTDFQPDGTAVLDDRIGMAPSKVVRAGIFLVDEVVFGTDEAWTMIPSLRVDHYDVSPDNTAAFLDRTKVPGTGESIRAVDYDNLAVAPSLSILRRLTPELNVYATYARGIRNPGAEELNGVLTHGADFIVVPNPDLKEETSDSVELGMQQGTANHQFQVAAFHNWYRDFLESNVLVEETPDPEPDVLTTVNRQRVRIYGLEARWDGRIDEALVGFQGLESGLSLSWTRGRQTDTNQPLNSVEPWRAVGYIGYRAPDNTWNVRLTGTYIGRKSHGSINQTTDVGILEPLPGVFLLDLSGEWHLSETWSIHAGLNNLTDRSYFLWSTARRGGHGDAGADRMTQPGINGFLGLTARF